MSKQELAPNPMGELAAAWTAWREQIDDSERGRVAEIIAASDLDSKPGINKLAKDILVEVFRGTLSPVVLQAAKPWIELIIFNIDSMNQAAGNKNGTAGDVIAVMAELRNSMRPLQPVYTVALIPETPNVINNEPEAVRLTTKVENG